MKNNKGQSLIEIIIAFGIASIFLPAIVVGFTSTREGRVQQQKRLDATVLYKEAVDAVRTIRESGWENISANGVYHPELIDSNWVLVAGEEIVGDFTRTVSIKDTYRDSNGNITLIGGSLDPSTKKITVLVSWSNIFFSSVSSDMYVVRYLGNASYIETLDTEFDLGTLSGTVVTVSDDGEVRLSPGGSTSWCSPNLDLSPLDLPKQGVANAISAIEGQAFVGTGDNASGVSFADVSITNENPPGLSVADTFDGYKTNDVFGESGYAYLATDNNSKEVVIINLTPPYFESGSFNAPGPVNVDSVYVVGDIGYAVAGNILYSFDLSSKNGERGLLDTDGLTLSGVGTDIMVVDTTVYVSLDSSSNQMQIVDASNPENLQLMGSVSVNANGAVSLFVNGSQTRAYLATSSSESQNELFVLDIGNKNSPQVLSGYNTNGMDPKAITVVPGNKAIIVGFGAEEYQVVDIASELFPQRCGGLNIDSGIKGISTVIEGDGDVFSYILTGDHTEEFRAIEGGEGDGFSILGDFESQIFDAGKSVAFNRFESNFLEPNLTNIKFQFAIGNGGDCSLVSYDFVGPDKTSSTFFENSSQIPLDSDGVGYENPGKCLKYKVFFETQEATTSPVFSDININYSP